MKKWLGSTIGGLLPIKNGRTRSTRPCPRDRFAELEAKIDKISRNVDCANEKLVWLEAITRTKTMTAQLPESQGWKRLMHSAGGKMLELVDIICQDNNIPYFLYGGSLIGAKLYQKSIQWDDDWDIGMLRDDYEKFRALCEQLFLDSDFKPAFIGFAIQFQFRNTLIHGDVFPFDQYYKDINTREEMDELTDRLIEAKKQNDWQLWHWEEALEENRSPKIRHLADYQKTKEIYKDVIMQGKKPEANGVLLENATNPGKMVNGRRQYFTPLNNVYKYDWIFPLTRIEYEGVEVSAPNDIDAVLGQKFGDIYDLPPVLDSHSLSLRFCDIDDARQLLEMDMKKVYKALKTSQRSRDIE